MQLGTIIVGKISDLLFNLRTKILGTPAPRVAVLRLHGVIASGGRFKENLNFASLVGNIERAFSVSGVSAVAIQINSPGGSPVQSQMIVDRIRVLAEEKNLPVITFAEDVAASGGYMLACAGDEIFAAEASLVGSIGVIASGFGFQQVMEKIGVERRLYTAGERKAMLDPFSPEDDQDVARIKEIQHEIHEQFKAFVRGRRGKRLKGLRGKIFSGDVFTGTEAVKLGLVDGIGDLRSVCRERFGEKVTFHVIEEKKSKLSGLLSMQTIVSNLGASNSGQGLEGAGLKTGEGFAHGILAAIEERIAWQKFGL